MKPVLKTTLVTLTAVGVILVGASWATAADRPGGGWLSGSVFGAHAQMGQGFDRGGPGSHVGAAGGGVMAGGVVMDAAADYIGVSESTLMTARHDGKSLSQVAVEHGKTADGLQQALVAAFQTNLNQAVAAGRLTEAQSAQALTTFRSQLQVVIDRTDTGPMYGRGGGGMGLGLQGAGR